MSESEADFVGFTGGNPFAELASLEGVTASYVSAPRGSSEVMDRHQSEQAKAGMMSHLGGAIEASGTLYDPEIDDLKKQQFLEWAIGDMGMDPPKFLDFISRMDFDTLQRYGPKPLIDRLWMMSREAIASKAMRQLNGLS